METYKEMKELINQNAQELLSEEEFEQLVNDIAMDYPDFAEDLLNIGEYE